MQQEISDHYTGVIRSNLALVDQKIETWQQDIEAQTAQSIIIEVRKLSQELRELRGTAAGAVANSANDESIHKYLERHREDKDFMPAAEKGRAAFGDNVAQRMEIEKLRADVMEQQNIIASQKALIDMNSSGTGGSSRRYDDFSQNNNNQTQSNRPSGSAPKKPTSLIEQRRARLEELQAKERERAEQQARERRR